MFYDIYTRVIYYDIFCGVIVSFHPSEYLQAEPLDLALGRVRKY